MVLMVAGASAFSLGAFIASGQTARSTYVCFHPIDSRPGIIFLQFVGLLLDAVIIILSNRILAWTRTTEMRLRFLGSVLVASSTLTGAAWIVTRFWGATPGFGLSLSALDLLEDSLVLAGLMVSTSLWLCETSTVTPISTVTLIISIWTCSLNVFRLGDWMHTSRFGSLFALWLASSGAVLFAYTHDLQSILFLRRFTVTVLILILVTVATLYTLVKQVESFDERHPISELISEARAKHDRWLLRATTSKSLMTAVTTYRERHSGRAPPPNFGEWFRYAAETAIIDEFKQIDHDLASFWQLSPAEIRKRVDAVVALPDVASITITGGQVKKSELGEASQDEDLAEVVEMIQKFSKHLPDMVLPINLKPIPRVLPSWRDARYKHELDLGQMANFIAEKRGAGGENGTVDAVQSRGGRGPSTAPGAKAGSSEVRRMQSEACPPSSLARNSRYWNFDRFCHACAQGHSRGQFLTDLDQSLDVCAQPDLKFLHSFSLRDRTPAPIRQLVPLFGASKTDEYQDVLIPIPRSRQSKADVRWKFKRRFDYLFWRGTAGDDYNKGDVFRGGQKFRLLHLIKKPAGGDEVRMMLPVRGWEHPYRIRKVGAAEASKRIPFAVGIVDSSPCEGGSCEMANQVYGTEADTEEASEYRYVLLMDDDEGPPGEVLSVLRSRSVPFVASIFRSWYTERLRPWLHFVPVDLRFQGLHTTLAFFAGVGSGPGATRGGLRGMRNHEGDGEWISQQGEWWSRSALGPRDMEAYLFRLLLEWGRLVNDGRNEIGYGQDEGEANG